MKIEIRHSCVEQMRNGEWDHTDSLVGSFNLTARGLAAAARALDDDAGYYRRVFGPGTISPRHGTYARIVYGDGSTLPLQLDDYRPRPEEDYPQYRTWTQAAAALAEDAERDRDIADPADISA